MLLKRALVAVGMAAALVLGMEARSAVLGASTARACGSEHYTSRGVIKEFGPERGSVAIAHEAIAGYLPANLDVFDAGERKQLDAFNVGDKVSFAFKPFHDGRRVIMNITRDAVSASTVVGGR